MGRRLARRTARPAPRDAMDRYEFLSPDWIAAAKTVRDDMAAHAPRPTVSVRINVVVVETPFGDGTVHGHVDTSSGEIFVEEGHLDDADLVITVDHATARALFVERDAQAVMQAFFKGKIRAEGDATKLLTLQPPAADTVDPVHADFYDRIRAFTI